MRPPANVYVHAPHTGGRAPTRATYPRARSPLKSVHVYYIARASAHAYCPDYARTSAAPSFYPASTRPGRGTVLVCVCVHARIAPSASPSGRPTQRAARSLSRKRPLREGNGRPPDAPRRRTRPHTAARWRTRFKHPPPPVREAVLACAVAADGQLGVLLIALAVPLLADRLLAAHITLCDLHAGRRAPSARGSATATAPLVGRCRHADGPGPRKHVQRQI